MRITVVTPSLNQGAYLSDCLKSVREAAGSVDVEHWVIDGGSTDETMKILSGQQFARWISEPDEGQADAINKGLQRATGDILCYLCADDTLEPGSLANVVEAFEKNPDTDLVYGDAYFLESDSGWKRLKKAGIFSYDRLTRKGNFLLQPAVFWKRRIYKFFGGFDKTLHYCMDHEFWLRIGGQSVWHYLEEPLATCRLHADAKTSRSLARAWREAVEMQARYDIRVRPRLEALWMQLAGQYYYLAKRKFFARYGKLRHAHVEPPRH